MKPLRLLLFACALSAQTPEPDVSKQAHIAYNEFACLANEWASHNSPYTYSRADSERLKKAIKAFDKFVRLAKDAQLIGPTKKRKKEN